MHRLRGLGLREPFQYGFHRFSRRGDSRSVTYTSNRSFARKSPYATICNPTDIVEGPGPKSSQDEPIPPLIDHHVFVAASRGNCTSLDTIIKQYAQVSGVVLNVCLAYEPHPSETRRVNTTVALNHDRMRNVVTVAHCAAFPNGHKVTLASGFALNVDVGEEMVIITCGHTLEEMRPLMSETRSTASYPHSSGSFIVLQGKDRSLEVYPVSRVLSALPQSDLMLLSCPVPFGKLETLPMSPYPAQKGVSVHAHLVEHQKPEESGWSPWIGDTWRKWAQGNVLGYRDFAGRETQPGTYDSLSHLFFTPLPTRGSSGSPIIDDSTGSVVGVILGTRLDNLIEGRRGWGVPSETVFEMFSLPGLEDKK